MGGVKKIKVLETKPVQDNISSKVMCIVFVIF